MELKPKKVKVDSYDICDISRRDVEILCAGLLWMMENRCTHYADESKNWNVLEDLGKKYGFKKDPSYSFPEESAAKEYLEKLLLKLNPETVEYNLVRYCN